MHKKLSYSNSVLKQAGNAISRRHTLSDFLTTIVPKHQKIEGGHLGRNKFPKKSYNAKKLKGGPFGLARYSILR